MPSRSSCWVPFSIFLRTNEKMTLWPMVERGDCSTWTRFELPKDSCTRSPATRSESREPLAKQVDRAPIASAPVASTTAQPARTMPIPVAQVPTVPAGAGRRSKKKEQFSLNRVSYCLTHSGVSCLVSSSGSADAKESVSGATRESSFHRNDNQLDWSERSLRRRQQQTSTPSLSQTTSSSIPVRSPHRVTLFDLCSTDGNGLDWRTIKVGRHRTSSFKINSFLNSYVSIFFSMLFRY